MVAVILFVIVFVGAILISKKTNTNMGIICIAGAFILGGWYAGTPAATIISYFPTSVLATLLFTAFMFGYINQTKSFHGIVDRILWATRGKTWFYPFALYLCVVLLCAVGGNSTAPVIMSPIAFSIAASTGMNPLLAVISTYMGSGGMGMASWTPGGAVFSGLMVGGCGDQAMAALKTSVLVMMIGSIIFLIVAYFILGGNKLSDNGTFKVEKPQPFTREQKIALGGLVFVVAMTLIPGVGKNFATGGLLNVFTWMGNNLAVNQCACLVVLAFALLGVGDGRAVVKDMMPWGTMIDIGGAVMLINCAQDLGIIKMVSDFAAKSVPGFLMPLVCVLVAGLLSFVSNAMGILPLLCPVVAEMASASGQKPAILCACLLVGCCATGLSPVSMGGSLHVMGASKEQREAIFGKQFLCAFIYLILYMILAVLGVFQICGKLFGI